MPWPGDKNDHAKKKKVDKVFGCLVKPCTRKVFVEGTRCDIQLTKLQGKQTIETITTNGERTLLNANGNVAR